MWRYGALLILVVTGFMDRGFACSCFGRSRPCEYLLSDVAFVGHVIETKAAKHQVGDHLWEGFSMRFSVEEPLRGDLGGEVIVETGAGGGDCGTPLNPGDGSFLIFAYRNGNGELWTGLCSGNRKLSGNPQNGQFLEDLRAMVKTGKNSISGFVHQEDLDTQEQAAQRGQALGPVQGMVVQATSDSFSAVTKTEKDGSYKFEGLPKGHYKVVPQMPSGLDVDHHLDRFTEADLVNGACARVSFVLKPATRIRVHVITSPAADLRELEVFALPVAVNHGDRYDKSAVVDENGRFDLWPLLPGDYWVRVNFRSTPDVAALLLPVYYPGVVDRKAAAVVHVEHGQSKDVELFLPEPKAVRKVHFVALDRNGKPMSAMKIELEDMRLPGTVESEVRIGLDRDGEGDVNVSAGYSYHLHGSSLDSGDQAWCSMPAQIAAGTTPVQVRFVMDRKSDDCDMERIDGRRE